MAKINTTAYIILGLLKHEDLSGYDIKKRIDVMISHFWEAGYGQIYPTLKTLEQDGWILRRSGGAGKGPERNIYSITEAGKAALQVWLEIPEAKEYTRYEILLKLFFGSLVAPDENIRRIDLFKERHEQNLKIIQNFAHNLEQVLQEDEDHLYYYLTVLFGEQVYKAYLHWAEQATELLSKREGMQGDGKSASEEGSKEI